MHVGEARFVCARVLTHENRRQVTYQTGDRVRDARIGALAPAGDAFVRFDLEEALARRNDKSFELRDFH
jgi:hypothetical protein